MKSFKISSVKILGIFIVAMQHAACTTTKPWLKAPLLMSPAIDKTAELLKLIDKSDREIIGDYFIVKGKSAEKLKPELKPIASDSSISKRFCATWFPNQSSLFEGGIENVYLADRRVQAIEDLEILLEKNEGTKCLLVRGTAVEVK